MRSLSLVIALLALVAAGIFVFGGGSGAEPIAGPGAAVEAGAPDPEPRRADGRAAAAEPRRGVPEGRPAAAPEAAGERRAALVVEVVHAADGAAVPDLDVVAERQRVGDALPERYVATTDAAGVARFAELPAGPWTVAAAIRLAGLPVTVEPGRTATLRIEIGDGVVVRGRVEDPSGRGLADARIWLSTGDPHVLGAVAGRTAADGTFALRGVRRWQGVAAFADGFAASPVHPVTVADGVRDLRFVLSPRTGGVAGRVVDDRGRAVEGARILVGADLRPADRRADDGARVPGPAPREARTDAGGAFEVAHLEPGTQPIQVAARGFAPFVSAVQVGVGERAEVAIALQPGAVVAGTVRDGRGAPVASAVVAVTGAPVLARPYAVSDREGRYRIEDVAVGEVDLAAEPGTGAAGTPPVTARVVTQSGGEVRWDPVLEVVRVDPAAQIAGRVVGIDGRGIGGYRVVAEPDPPQRTRAVSAFTGEDGGFRLEVPWPQVRLLVFAEAGGQGFPVAVVSPVARGAADVHIVVDRQTFSALRARLVDTTGRPVGATLQIWHETARIWREVASAPETGAVEVEPIPPGRCTLEVRSPDHPWLRLGERELPAGGVLDLGELVLEPGGRIEGGVTFVDGGPPTALTLRFVDEGAGREVGVAEVRDGRYRSNPLPLGELVMVVEGEGIAAARLPVPLDARAPVRVVDLSVERGVPVTLRFAFPPGVERPAWLNVGIFRDRDAVWTRGIGRAAALEVTIGLAPGSYRALAQAGEPLADVAFEVRGQPVTVDVPLRGR